MQHTSFERKKICSLYDYLCVLCSQYLQNAFTYFDTQRQGIITLEDLQAFMGGSATHAKEIMDEVDTNNDGKISFEEFVQMMEGRGGIESGGDTPVITSRKKPVTRSDSAAMQMEKDALK